MKITNYSSVFPRKNKTKTILFACAMTASAVVSAEIKVSAFAEARGFDALMNGDLERANRVLPEYRLRDLNYADANNLCVLQILKNKDAQAVKACRVALTKISSTSMSRSARRKLQAEIYTNLGAAQMLGGDYASAQSSLEKALDLSKTADRVASNAAVNQEVLRSRLLAAN